MCIPPKMHATCVNLEQSYEYFKYVIMQQNLAKGILRFLASSSSSQNVLVCLWSTFFLSHKKKLFQRNFFLLIPKKKKRQIIGKKLYIFDLFVKLNKGYKFIFSQKFREIKTIMSFCYILKLTWNSSKVFFFCIVKFSWNQFTHSIHEAWKDQYLVCKTFVKL